MLQRKPAIAARILLAVVAVATPSQAAVHFQKSGSSEPTVQSTVVVGSIVAVTVANTSRESRTVTVEVVAVVNGAQVTGYETLSVPARDDATATVDFGAPVGDVVEVGLVEGCDPQ